MPFSFVMISICIIDVLFLSLYAYYSSLPLNIFVAALSLNLLLAGFSLRLIELLLVTSLSLLSFTFFLNFRGLLEGDYSVMYYGLNALSFAVYSASAYYLQIFFKKSKSEVGNLEKHLFKQRELNKIVLSSMSSSVFITGHGQMPFALNEPARKITEELGDALKDLVKFHFPKTDFHEDLEVKNKSYKVYASTLKNELAPEGMNQTILLVNDQTEAKKMERDLEEARKLSAIGTLSAGLAHEIRNPLAGISGSIELIKEGSLELDVSQKLYGTVLKEIERLNALVTDFLNFASPELQNEEEVDLKSICQNVIDLLKMDPRTEGVSLQLDCQSHQIYADKNKLQQVIMNLVINAAQAFDEEHKGLLNTRGEVSKVSIKGAKLDSGYIIKVEDNGKGIEKSRLNKIFEPFHTTKDKGTGLGLALSHRILNMHGAGISVESQVGEGTVFTITFK
jgi:two-component system sensor histidine kinase PilS (NtrC family)